MIRKCLLICREIVWFSANIARAVLMFLFISCCASNRFKLKTDKHTHLLSTERLDKILQDLAIMSSYFKLLLFRISGEVHWL